MCRTINEKSCEALEKTVAERLRLLNLNYCKAREAGFDLKEKYKEVVEQTEAKIRSDAMRLVVVSTLLPSMSYFSSTEEAFSYFKRDEEVIFAVFYKELMEDISSPDYKMDEEILGKYLDSIQSTWLSAMREIALVDTPEINEFMARYESYSKEQ